MALGANSVSVQTRRQLPAACLLLDELLNWQDYGPTVVYLSIRELFAREDADRVDWEVNGIIDELTCEGLTISGSVRKAITQRVRANNPLETQRFVTSLCQSHYAKYGVFPQPPSVWYLRSIYQESKDVPELGDEVPDHMTFDLEADSQPYGSRLEDYYGAPGSWQRRYHAAEGDLGGVAEASLHDLAAEEAACDRARNPVRGEYDESDGMFYVDRDRDGATVSHFEGDYRSSDYWIS